LMVDAEPMRSGEDEVATAIRLLERVIASYPRAFDVVIADALYTDPQILQIRPGRRPAHAHRAEGRKP